MRVTPDGYRHDPDERDPDERGLTPPDRDQPDRDQPDRDGWALGGWSRNPYGGPGDGPARARPDGRPTRPPAPPAADGRDPYRRPAAGHPDDPYRDDSYRAEPYAAEPYAAEPYAADPRAGDPYGADPYGGDPYGAARNRRDPRREDPPGGNHDRGDPYGNTAYGNTAYGNTAYGNTAYGNTAYGNTAYRNGSNGNASYGGDPYAGDPYAGGRYQVDRYRAEPARGHDRPPTAGGYQPVGSARTARPAQPARAERAPYPDRTGSLLTGGSLIPGVSPPPGGGRPPGGRRPPEAEPPRGRGGLAAQMALLSIVAGLALAGLAIPFASGLGLFSKASADNFVNLPANLITPPLAQNTRILAADGSTVAVLRGAQDRVVAPLAQIPPIMQTALIDIEDSRFYSHGGVDVKGMLRAAVHDSSSDTGQQGGSTLTQQYVKNVLVQSASNAKERQAAVNDSLARKLQEARYAVALEKQLTKKQILERYLNIAYFGDGAYGVGTASQHYFGKAVSAVTLSQAALLAGLVQSPSDYDPFTDPAAAKARRDVVLDRMAQLGSITTAQATAAKATPLGVRATRPVAPPDSCQSSKEPFFCDYVRTALLSDTALGATAQERSTKVYEGGLIVHTTLDPTVQAAAQAAVNATVPVSSTVSATEVVVQPGTGNVLAMAVNRDYGTNAAVNQTTLKLPTSATFQPGSTFKAFTLTTALEQGYGLSTAFYSPACYVSQQFQVGNNSGRQAGGSCAQGFTNADPAEAGVYDMSKATWNSVNTYFVQLEEKVGVLNVASMATRLGIPAPYVSGAGASSLSLTIGGYAVTPLDMANAYATLAAHGTRCDVRPVTGATDASGNPVDIATTKDGTTFSATNKASSGRSVVIGGAPSCTQAVSAGVADTATSVLAGVITNGTGYPNAAAVGRPAAGKTGTMDGFVSAWFIGYTPQMSAAVAVGDPRGPNTYPLKNIAINGRTWPEVFGGDLPAIIWGQSMKAALATLPVVALSPADPTVAAGTKGGLLNTPPPSATPSAGASASPTDGVVVPPIDLPTGIVGPGQPNGH